jgi:hypothetical protein
MWRWRSAITVCRIGRWKAGVTRVDVHSDRAPPIALQTFVLVTHVGGRGTVEAKDRVIC